MKADPPVDVLIVGAGFAGLGSAIRLRRAGITNITWIEKDSGIGGTWWANRYPGAACDIPTPLYSFSFAPNPNWTRLYPPQAEIQAYLADTARRFGVAPQFQVELRSLAWQDDARQWLARLRDADGREFEVRARAVIAATDGLSRPKWPDIDGLHDFAGPLLHTARWRDDVALAGKRIGVIGTGASAIQLVPELARQAAGLTIFQRSAPWVVARADRPLRASERWLCAHMPGYAKAWRAFIYLRNELRGLGFTRRPRLLRMGESLAQRNMKRHVKDPALRALLTPDYRMGCKRILISDDYYPALTRPNVRVVTDAIQRIERDGVRTADGRLHALDVLVAATGFEAAEAGPPCTITGVNGRSLADDWRHGAVAYLGTLAAGYPNLFLMTGPNTGLGHNSIIHIIESQIALVLDALKQLRKRGACALDVRAAAQQAFNDEIQQRLAGTIWAIGGCTSWYRRRDGRIVAMWPGSTLEYRRRTRWLDPSHVQFIR